MTSPLKDKMILGFSLAANGTHKAGWRHPDAVDGVAVDIGCWMDMAKAAEAAKVHFIFLADGVAVRTEADDTDLLSYNGRIDQFEPLTLIAALSAVTSRIGFVATASTTYNEPYHIARKYASLDHISHGRAGWNVVTSWSQQEALNFSRDSHLQHETRYRRAEEFVDVVFGLWDGWEDDAFLRDKAEGRYFDPAKLHVLDHKGEFFQVRGPLNIPRPPQGRPVIAQAGGSEPGQALAARTADLIYTAQQTKEDAVAFRHGILERVAFAGRDPGQVRVLPGVHVVIGDTQDEAEAKFEELQALIHPKIGLSLLKHVFGDMSGLPLDEPLPESFSTDTEGTKSIKKMWAEKARRENLTIRQLYQLIGVSAGHFQLVGTPASIADTLEEWFRAGACDGFNFMVPYMPGGLDAVTQKLIPELQRRGLAQTDYAGETLRENLGLHRPAEGEWMRAPAPLRVMSQV